MKPESRSVKCLSGPMNLLIIITSQKSAIFKNIILFINKNQTKMDMIWLKRYYVYLCLLKYWWWCKINKCTVFSICKKYKKKLPNVIIVEHYNDGKKTDSPQVQNYLHCQYKLLPDDKDYIKTDIVTFGMAAKMYGDNDSKVLRTWIDGDKTWIAWTNRFVVDVVVVFIVALLYWNNFS